MVAYTKGARVERKLRTILEQYGFPSFRVAGSRGVDLVIGGIPIEVKYRAEFSPLFYEATRALLDLGNLIAGPLADFFDPYATPRPWVEKGPKPRWQDWIPPQGILALKLPRREFIFVATKEVRERALQIARREPGRL